MVAIRFILVAPRFILVAIKFILVAIRVGVEATKVVAVERGWEWWKEAGRYLSG